MAFRSSARASAPTTATSSCRSCASTSSSGSPTSSGDPSGRATPGSRPAPVGCPTSRSDIRPAIEAWLRGKTRLEAVELLSEAGIAAGPSNSAEDLVHDPHVEAHHMLVEMPRTDDVDDPILVPGMPIKMSKVTEGPDTRVPWVGEHTEAVLRAELGLDSHDLSALRDDGVVT
ncbi:MAG: CoA transferase [Acidimicrobiia bacterium]|nr:CoA transferase [Acidimicrobiia bacterium]